MADSSHDLDVVQAAKLLRAELAKAFPATKFSVRSSRFSMGEAIDISWTDGPSSDKVEKITSHHKDISRDGYGDILAGGNRYVQCDRSYSAKAVAWAKSQVSTPPEPGDERRILHRTSFDAAGRPHQSK